MKLIIFLFATIISNFIYAIESDVFNSKFPGFNQYQSSIFSSVKNYLELIPNKSIVYNLDKNLKKFLIPNKNPNQEIEIVFQIIREVKINQITETMFYSVSGSAPFIYRVIKKGEAISESDTLDLQLMRFRPSRFDDEYEIQVPSLNISLKNSREESKETTFLNLGFVGFNISIETNTKQAIPYRHYLYFYKDMPNPQASVSVFLYEYFNTYLFSYTSSQAGQLTENDFNFALAGANGLFEASSEAMIFNLRALGFPKL
jgi:hypothetical protein